MRDDLVPDVRRADCVARGRHEPGGEHRGILVVGPGVLGLHDPERLRRASGSEGGARPDARGEAGVGRIGELASGDEVLRLRALPGLEERERTVVDERVLVRVLPRLDGRKELRPLLLAGIALGDDYARLELVDARTLRVGPRDLPEPVAQRLARNLDVVGKSHERRPERDGASYASSPFYAVIQLSNLQL